MQKELAISKSLAIAELKDLANVDGPCITMYLPLEPAPNTSRVDFVRLKSGIRQAEQKLADMDVSSREIHELLESVRHLENEADQWGGHGGSLVVFKSPAVFRAFQVHQELDETVVVGDSFYAFPLIRALQIAEQVFYILALSQNHIRLLRCTSTDSKEVDLPEGTPTSLEQWLTTRNPNSAPDHGVVESGEAGTMTGDFTSTQDRDNRDEYVGNFFRVINKAVFELLRDEKHPLIVAGVDHQLSMYKDINDYPYMVDEGVQGSPESLKGGEMHRRAFELVQDFFAQPARKALALWDKIAGSDRVSTSFPEILTAAFEARIAHLFVAEGARTLGAFDRNTMQMRAGGRQQDLVNAAALQTIAYGGDVFVMDQTTVPGGGQMAAILRF
jgi:hypothetical protein